MPALRRAACGVFHRRRLEEPATTAPAGRNRLRQTRRGSV